MSSDISKVTIKIDGQNFQVSRNSTILNAAKECGFKIPTLCHYEKLEPYTSCFVCLVEVKGARGFVPACSSKVSEGMDISVSSEIVKQARKTALELLVSDHAGDCEPPCVATCPAGVKIRDFLSLAANGEYVKSAQKIRENLPFPGSLGRVCPRYCEDKCRRKDVEESVSVCFMKRFVSDEEMKQGGPFLPKPSKETGKKVAIIGAGPAGLTAAYFLRLKGHSVTIFEKHAKAGGMLKWGIPDYRLPPEILDKECESIINLGVEVKYNTTIDKDIFEKIKVDFDVVFIAIGAQKSSDMPLEGETDKGIVSGIDLLERLAKGERPDLGAKVVVVGGGNTAMDAARSSVRLGADVTVLYRRTEKEMPANSFEIAEAKHEGVKFEFLVAPTKVTRSGEMLNFECIRMALGQPDASGRRRPVPVQGSEFIVEATTCITAIGQQVDPSIADGSNLKLTKWGTFIVEPKTYATNVNGIFAAGDCVLGADVAVRAIDAGRKAAYSMDQFLRGEKVIGEPVKFNSATGREGISKDVLKNIASKAAAKMPTEDASQRVKDFREVEIGFSVNEAASEAERCLKCGCVEADTCKLREYCTEYGVDQSHFKGELRSICDDSTHKQVVLESGKCINCGICVRLLEKEGADSLAFIKRGFETRVKPPFDKQMVDGDAVDYREVAEACPTAGIVLRENYGKKGIAVPNEQIKSRQKKTLRY